MTVFERIQELAKKQAISLQKVAEDNSFSSNLIYRWKKSEPKAADLAKIADYFHTTTDYLLGRTDDPSIPGNNAKKSETDLSWADLDMPYGGKIPNELKGYYKAIAIQYAKDHPELMKKRDEN